MAVIAMGRSHLRLTAASADFTNPAVEGAPLTTEPLAAHQEFMLTDAQGLAPVTAVAVPIDSLALS